MKLPIGTKLKYSNPLAKGLVGCWLFNEAGGSKVFDSSFQRNHGQLLGDIGKWRGGGLDLISTGYIQIAASNSINDLPQFTYAIRTTLQTLNSGSARWFNKGGGLEARGGVLVFGQYNIDITIGFSTTSATAMSTNIGSSLLNKEGLLVFTFDGVNSPRIYWRGEEVSYQSSASPSGTRTSDNSSNLRFNRNHFSQPGVTARHQYALLYNRVLTPQEIKSLSDNPYSFLSPQRETYEGYSIPKTGLRGDVWQDFELDSLSTTELDSHDHCDAGTWTLFDTDSQLTLENISSGGHPATRINGIVDTGTKALSMTLTTVTNAYVRFNKKFGSLPVSAGFWLYVPTLPTGSYGVATFGNIVAKISIRNTGTGYRIQWDSVNRIDGITPDAWYWVTALVSNNTANTLRVYDTTGTQVGSDATSVIDTSTFSTVLIGNQDNNTPGVAIKYDDVVIDYTSARFPLLPFAADGEVVSFNPLFASGFLFP